MRLELQRLLVRGAGGLPDHVVVDVSALIRRQIEVAPGANIWTPLLAARSRSPLDIVWIVAPTAEGSIVGPAELAAAAARLQVGGASVIESTEPAAALLLQAVIPGERVGLVSAGLEERPYELWAIATASCILDVETGVLWRQRDVEEQFGRPDILPELLAIVGADGFAGLGGRAAPRYVPGIRAALEGSTAWSSAPVHPSIRTLVGQRRTQIGARAEALRGGGALPDASAVAALDSWLHGGGPPRTAYVVARLTRTDSRYELHEVRAEAGARRMEAVGDVDASLLLQNLVASVPGRWFAPHAMDLLAAMDERGLTLPAVAIDPALAAYVTNTASPPTLTELTPGARTPRAAAAWMDDRKRKLPAPTDLEPVLGSLRRLDDALASVLVQKQLSSLIEDDLGRTLPVLARIERMGAWVGQPQGFKDWEALFKATEMQLQQYEQDAADFTRARIDIYSAEYAELVGALKWKQRLPLNRWGPDLSPKQQFERFVALRTKEAVAVEEARSLTSKSGSYFWFKEIARSPTQLRGLSVPQKHGRFGMRNLPLQNFPKRSALANAMRSGLLAPPNHVLVGADQNGYEVRLLADLSRDPNLLAATAAPDVHAAIAQQLFGNPAKREQAKLGMYAALYGQSEDQFRKSRPELTNADAVALYNKVLSTFPRVFAYRNQQLQAWQGQTHACTRGGWPLVADPNKSAKSQERSMFNGLVQGLAADIQRWVLRELDRDLRQYDSRIVHQAHDEVFVAVPAKGNTAAVEQLLVDTMTTAVMKRSGLLQIPVRLVATARRGSTWLDMI